MNGETLPVLFVYREFEDHQPTVATSYHEGVAFVVITEYLETPMV